MKQQRCLVALVLIGIATVAHAQTTEERIVLCAKVIDQQQRLVCFENLARDVESGWQKVSREHAQEPAASLDTPLVHSELSDQSSKGDFGLEHKDGKEALSDKLQSHVVEIYKNSLGKMILTLDNGQIWQQMDTKSLIIHKGDLILIERGALSAFYLSAKGKKRIRVVRVR